MKKTKKAIGYVCDIPIQGTDMVITKEDQRMRLIKFAKKENLELVEICEDDCFTEEFMDRPGVRRMLNCGERYDCLLVERVWCLSRKRKNLDPFLAQLDQRGVEVVASSYLWDCVSQMVRHRYAANVAEKCKAEVNAQAPAKTAAPKTAKSAA
jgi:DNA invertase Pin-like site-specific DNA recombinase